MPGVFHPGLFYSTRFLIDYMLECDLRGKTLLELGCGTGLLSIIGHRNGALVTASDRSFAATNNATLNAIRNDAKIQIIQSNLFESIRPRIFSLIFINPPYYKGNPRNEAEMAWYSGAGMEYFHGLFAALADYMDDQTSVIMVLTRESPLHEIISIAASHDFIFQKIKEKAVLFDGTDFLFRIVLNRGPATDQANLT